MKKRVIISLTLIVFIFSIFFLHKVTLMNSTNERYIQISGKVQYENGKGIKDIKVYTVDDKESYIATTNENGEYNGFVLSNDKQNIKIKLKYPDGSFYTVTSLDAKKITYKTNFNCDTARVTCNYPSGKEPEIYQIISGKLGKILEDNNKTYENYHKEYGDQKQFIRNIAKDSSSIGIGMTVKRKILEICNINDGIIDLKDTIDKGNFGINMIFNTATQELLSLDKENISFKNDIFSILEQAYIYLDIEKNQETIENIKIDEQENKECVINELSVDDHIINLKLKKVSNQSTPGQQGNSNVTVSDGDCSISGVAKVDSTGIQNVKVELYDEGTCKATARTDSNGRYSFTGLNGATSFKEKNYTIKFTYGDYIQLSSNKTYNGQDYETAKSSEAKDWNNRRMKINENYESIQYQNGNKLSVLELENDDNTFLNEVATNTYMIAFCEVNFKKPETKRKDGINLILKEREKNEIKIENYISNIKVTLSNGQNIINSSFDKNGKEKISGVKKYLISLPDLKEITNIKLDLLYGSTLEIEYSIEIKSENYTNTVDIYSYINNEEKIVEGKNNGWNKVDLSNPTTNIIDDMKNKDKTILSRTVTVNKGDSKTIKIITSRSLDASGDEIEYNNYAEIANYKNNDGRRIYKTIPANLNICSENFEDSNMERGDTDKSEDLIIVPPTGKTHYKKYIKEYKKREKQER